MSRDVHGGSRQQYNLTWRHDEQVVRGVSHMLSSPVPSARSPLWQMSFLGTPALSTSQWCAVILEIEGGLSYCEMLRSSMPFKVTRCHLLVRCQKGGEKKEWTALSRKARDQCTAHAQMLSCCLVDRLTIHRWRWPVVFSLMNSDLLLRQIKMRMNFDL